MKKILIYGDSNVWGDNFKTQKRIEDEKQWANLLQEELKENYKIYQEGLPGRLAGNDEKVKKYKNGKLTFLATFKTVAPVNIIIIALGSNDLNIKYNKESKKIIRDLLWYKNVIKREYEDEETRAKYFNNIMPKIIYILPPNFELNAETESILNSTSETKRQEIITYFKNTKDNNIIINDVSLFEDGIHLDYKGHKYIANIVKECILNNE